MLCHDAVLETPRHSSNKKLNRQRQDLATLNSTVQQVPQLPAQWNQWKRENHTPQPRKEPRESRPESKNNHQGTSQEEMAVQPPGSQVPQLQLVQVWFQIIKNVPVCFGTSRLPFHTPFLWKWMWMGGGEVLELVLEYSWCSGRILLELFLIIKWEFHKSSGIF